MQKFAIVVHGGAGVLNAYLKHHIDESNQGLKEALLAGYDLLKKGGNALSAVESAVMKLEDNPLFNAGRGSALNMEGVVEMDASIMDGKNLKAGAVSMVRTVKNPILLARSVMTKTPHVFLSGYGALELAKVVELDLKSKSYFLTPYQKYIFDLCKKRNKISLKRMHETVGAVALDKNGNLAAATSTGGTPYSLPGRIGDSCVIGAGCYADNKTCAISGTGEGEFLITHVVAHTISMLIEFKGYSLQKACDEVIHKNKPNPKNEMGVIALNKKGNIGISFNTQSMRRGYIDIRKNLVIQNDK